MSDANIVKSEQCNERITICLDAAGEPVQRAMAEMTEDELQLAVNWHLAETLCLFERMAQIGAMLGRASGDRGMPEFNTLGFQSQTQRWFNERLNALSSQLEELAFDRLLAKRRTHRGRMMHREAPRDLTDSRLEPQRKRQRPRRDS